MATLEQNEVTLSGVAYLHKVAGARAPSVKGMFKYFNQFVDAGKNGIDVLICDEAHRIRETSANRCTKAALHTGRPQVSELIDAARVPVGRQPGIRTLGTPSTRA